MKATELRIGNWIYEYGVKLSIIDGHDIDLMHDHWQPIPLTPEILEKCGFENRSTNPDYTKAWKIKVSEYRTLYLDFANDKWNCLLNNEVTAADIHHLHQLQNLYFALTGEELEINL